MSERNDFRISEVEPAHVMAVLNAYSRLATIDALAVLRFMCGITGALPHAVLEELADKARQLLPDVRRELEISASRPESGPDTERRREPTPSPADHKDRSN